MRKLAAWLDSTEEDKRVLLKWVANEGALHLGPQYPRTFGLLGTISMTLAPMGKNNVHETPGEHPGTAAHDFREEVPGELPQ